MSESLNQQRSDKLAHWCEQWGGSLTVLSRAEWPADASQAPIESCVCGLNWDRCEVYAERASEWPYIIHEMCHCFALHLPPEHAGPNESVGWQFMLACHLDSTAGAVWLQTMRLNGYDTGYDWRSVDWVTVQSYLVWAVLQARAIGLLDGLTPLAIRHPTDRATTRQEDQCKPRQLRYETA